jgi:AraC-like DNA-binding protein
VNCAAIPEDLIESELFGHVKGSFPGAAEDKIGKFKKADGGTLFLDEIGDMSLRTQSKVLRTLEEGRIDPVGSSQNESVDVRVLAATNKNLEQEIARGAFRQDLFYRLNVIPFFVPPLRDRKEDIPILSKYFLNEFSSAYGKRTRELSDTAMEILMRYPFPGNVRELRNLVERLVIVCPQARIEPHHLPPELFRGVAESPQHPYNTLHEARSAYEREFILRKLQENRWNMTQTAGALGLERSHLYRKMKSLGIAAQTDGQQHRVFFERTDFFLKRRKRGSERANKQLSVVFVDRAVIDIVFVDRTVMDIFIRIGFRAAGRTVEFFVGIVRQIGLVGSGRVSSQRSGIGRIGVCSKLGLGAAKTFELEVPVEFANAQRIFAPVRSDLHKSLQVNFRAEKLLEFFARFGADFL